MKKIYLIIILTISLSLNVSARDFIVEFISENYKETGASFSYNPLIYHSIQVATGAGSKVIILEGDDYNYRKWLRHYIADNKKFILKIDDNKNELFIASRAFKINLRQVHPIDAASWDALSISGGKSGLLPGDNYILVVDNDEQRCSLINNVAQKKGLQSICFKEGDTALHPFLLQPEKFIMVIANHKIISSGKNNFIDQLLRIDKNIPIVIDTGYNDLKIKKQYESRYSDFPAIYIEPMVLKELSKTIDKLTT